MRFEPTLQSGALLIAIVLSLSSLSWAQEEPGGPAGPTGRIPVEQAETLEEPLMFWADAVAFDEHGGGSSKIYEVEIGGTIDLGLAAFVERVALRATKEDLILLRIKTFGGRVDAAVRIRDALLNADAVSVAFVDMRAISAGALISLACHTIIMSPGGSIGAATPVQGGGADQASRPSSEKVVSYMRAEMRATAEARDRRGDLAEAMVDADIVVEGVTEKGKLLTLTTQKAFALKLVDGILDDYEKIPAALNRGKSERVSMEAHWGEKIARFLTDPSVSSLLMTFGMLGLLLEFYTPGFGVGGAIGALCLSLFFFGQYAANLVGFEEVGLLVFGLILVLIEIFAIPGFGLVGLLGFLFICAAFVMSLLETTIPVDVALDLGYLQDALESASLRIAILLVVATVASITFMSRFSKLRGTKAMILEAPPSEEGPKSTSTDFRGMKGKGGVAMTDLRPSGFVRIEGERINALTEGEFIPAGSDIIVLEGKGAEVVVALGDGK